MREKAAQDRLLLGAHARVGARGGLFEKAVGDFAGAAAADGRDAGDREQVLDQRLGAGMIGALQAPRARPDCEFAPWPPPLSTASSGRPCASPRRTRRSQTSGRPSAPSTPSNTRASPILHLQRAGAGSVGRLQREREDFGVRRLDVAAPVAFEAGLDHFAALAGAGAKDRAEIGVLRLGAALAAKPDGRGRRESCSPGAGKARRPEASVVR